jgi:hypothetical protein
MCVCVTFDNSSNEHSNMTPVTKLIQWNKTTDLEHDTTVL